MTMDQAIGYALQWSGAPDSDHKRSQQADDACSPEGIRTPDLFLEREALQKSDLATKTLGNDAPDRPERASEKGPISSHLNETLADLAAASLRLRGWIDARHQWAASPA